MIKNYIMVTLIVLCMSTMMAGYSSQPKPIKFGISDITFKPLTTSTPDGVHGEFKIVDGYKVYRAPDSIIDSYT